MPTMTPTRASARGASTAGTARKVGRGGTRGGGGLAGPATPAAPAPLAHHSAFLTTGFLSCSVFFQVDFRITDFF